MYVCICCCECVGCVYYKLLILRENMETNLMRGAICMYVLSAIHIFDVDL